MRKINFSSINKRHLTLIGLVVMIAVAGYININYGGTAVETVATVEKPQEKAKETESKKAEEPKSDPYTLAVMERDKKRSQSMEVYRDIIENSECDKETKENAQLMLTNSAKYINDENTIEASVKAKGINKNVVYIDEDAVTVLVYEVKLTGQQVSQIKDIVTGNTKISAEKIKIIENK